MFFQDDKSVAAAFSRLRNGENFLRRRSFSSRISPPPLLFLGSCFPQEHETHVGSVNLVLCKTAVTLANLPLLRARSLLNIDGM